MPFGATNAKGKLKHKSSTGKARFIDANKGLSQNKHTGELEHGTPRPIGKKPHKAKVDER